jgi:hypothetical protein
VRVFVCRKVSQLTKVNDRSRLFVIFLTKETERRQPCLRREQNEESSLQLDFVNRAAICKIALQMRRKEWKR